MAAALVSRFKTLLNEHFPILCILVGSALFTFTIGPYNNADTGIEFAAASNVLKYGMPYSGAVGNLINQPPLGYYIDSVFFAIVGLSFSNGAAIVTFFGLGCVLLVYLLGKAWYGKTTGLLAAALFALTPWEAILSRSFLIDVQCLFFSMIFLLVGIYAVRRDSLGLFLLSGGFFALAFLTKFYAVFMLVPLAVFYLFKRQKNLSNPPIVVAFFAPVMAGVFVWYDVLAKCSILNFISMHDDFTNFNSGVLVPSKWFVGSFLWENLGALFLVAAAIALIVGLLQTKTIKNSVALDAVCLITIIAIAGIDTALVLGFNFKAPYLSAAKYNYPALPFFCLLAASLLGKFQGLLAAKIKPNLRRGLLGCSLLGLVLLFASALLNFYSITTFPVWSYLTLTVEGSVSYSVNTTAQTITTGLVVTQYLGLALVLFGLVWAVRGYLGRLLRHIRRKSSI
jgi:4-amino-4-deoxy-L-arabinose transferase-like glycosyltransferase